MSDFAGYTKEIESKWVRTVHRVRFIEEKETAGGLVELLNKVPADLKIDEIEIDDDVDCTLVFVEDTRRPARGKLGADSGS